MNILTAKKGKNNTTHIGSGDGNSLLFTSIKSHHSSIHPPPKKKKPRKKNKQKRKIIKPNIKKKQPNKKDSVLNKNNMLICIF